MRFSDCRPGKKKKKIKPRRQLLMSIFDRYTFEKENFIYATSSRWCGRKRRPIVVTFFCQKWPGFTALDRAQNCFWVAFVPDSRKCWLENSISDRTNPNRQFRLKSVSFEEHNNGLLLDQLNNSPKIKLFIGDRVLQEGKNYKLWKQIIEAVV